MQKPPWEWKRNQRRESRTLYRVAPEEGRDDDDDNDGDDSWLGVKILVEKLRSRVLIIVPNDAG